MSWKFGFIFLSILTCSWCQFAYYYDEEFIEPEDVFYDESDFLPLPHPHPPSVVVYNINNFGPRERSDYPYLCRHDFQLYHNGTKRCYFPSHIPYRGNFNVRYPSPCGPLQEFIRISEGYGDCVCVRNENGCRRNEFGILNRPVLNWPGADKCYYAYDQGPCESGKWLVINPITHLPECRWNPCLGRTPERLFQGIHITPRSPLEIFWFLRDFDSDNNTCYQTFTQAYCQPGQFVMFAGTNRNPSCHFPFESSTCVALGSAQSSTSTSTQADCAKGFKKLPSGACILSAGGSA